MNLSVVYELRDRLEASAVAGVNLIQDDFRLQRAVERMTPFAAASPVFKKITNLARQVMEPQCPDRTGTFLDLMALIDAVLRTQGTIQTEGEILDLQERKDCTGSTGKIAVNVPYSQMAPLIDAFRGTGSGRYAVIRDTYKNNPELFSDYRVQSMMVEALGDSYSDLAEMVASWLEKADISIVPLLKRGFCKNGRKEMVRRVQVMDKVAGASENEFYLSLLEDSDKEIKEAAIRALRHDPANTEILLGLIKAERGKLKDAAKDALSYMNTEKAIAYWQKEMKKASLNAVQFLWTSHEDWASDMVADVLDQYMDDLGLGEKAAYLALSPEKKSELVSLWQAAVGKHSEKLCSCYLRAGSWLSETTGEILEQTLVAAPDPALKRLAEQLYQNYGDQYLACVFLSAMLFSSPEEVYDRFHEYFEPAGALNQLTGRKRRPAGIIHIFSQLSYQEKEKKFAIELNNDTFTAGRVQGKEIDMRWYPLLLSYKERFSAKYVKKKADTYPYDQNTYSNAYDAVIAQLYQPGQGLEESYREYFYNGIRKQGLTIGALRMLKRCGWEDFHNLLVYSNPDSMNMWEMMTILREMPFDGAELGRELCLLLEKKNTNSRTCNLLKRWSMSLMEGARKEELY